MSRKAAAPRETMDLHLVCAGFNGGAAVDEELAAHLSIRDRRPDFAAEPERCLDLLEERCSTVMPLPALHPKTHEPNGKWSIMFCFQDDFHTTADYGTMNEALHAALYYVVVHHKSAVT